MIAAWLMSTWPLMLPTSSSWHYSGKHDDIFLKYYVALQYLKWLCRVHLYDVGAPGKTIVSRLECATFQHNILRLFDLKKVRLQLLWWWLCLALALAAGPSSPTTSSCSSSSASSSAAVGKVASIFFGSFSFFWSSWTSYWKFKVSFCHGSGIFKFEKKRRWRKCFKIEVCFGATGAKVWNPTPVISLVWAAPDKDSFLLGTAGKYLSKRFRFGLQSKYVTCYL